MKLWRLSYQDDDLGTCLIWASSKRQARKLFAQVRRERDDPKEVELMHLWAEDVPTDRAGLVDWLNRHFATDNG